MWWPNQFPPCPGSGTPRSGSGKRTWVKARYMLHNSQTEIRFDNFFLYFYVLFSNNPAVSSFIFLRTCKRILPQASSVITIMLRLSRTTRASTTNAGLPGSVKASTAPGKMQIIDHENPSYPCDNSEAKLVVWPPVWSWIIPTTHIDLTCCMTMWTDHLPNKMWKI